MYYERKFTEAMLLLTGLLACLVITVYLTAPAKANAAPDALVSSQRADPVVVRIPAGPRLPDTAALALSGTRDSVLTKDPVLKLAHCCHAHPLPPYDAYCCHGGTTVYVAPRYGYGAVGVRGVSRRTSRRTSRRVSRRR